MNSKPEMEKILEKRKHEKEKEEEDEITLPIKKKFGELEKSVSIFKNL